MKVLIIHPEKVIYDGHVSMISLLSISGYFQILNFHAPILSSLKSGTINLHLAIKEDIKNNKKNNNNIFDFKNQKILSFEIQGGVVEVYNNFITILSI